MRQRFASGLAGDIGARSVQRPSATMAPMLALVVTLALAGCGVANAYANIHYPPTNAITSATTLRTGDFSDNHIAAFAATATNVVTLQRFYADMMALKRPANGIYNCPIDAGVSDHIAFYAQGKLVLRALIDEQGCGWVNFGVNGAQPVDSSPSGTSDTRSYLGNAQFWPLFAAAFNANPAYPETDTSTSGLVD